MKKIGFFGIVLGIFAGEHYIKEKIEKGVKLKRLPGILVTRYHNYGAFRNLGHKRPLLIKLVSVLLTVILSIVYIMTLGRAGKNLLKIGLSLLLGGAFSNTYDRLKRGYVVDYIRFRVKWRFLRDMIFNISDFFIIIGALLSGISA